MSKKVKVSFQPGSRKATEYSHKLRKGLAAKHAAERMRGMTDNEVASLIGSSSDAALRTPEWRALRQSVIEKYGAKCMCCGHVPKNPALINVDHVKPRKFFPELTLEESNLQVLCSSCNKRKGNKVIDYRQTLPKAWTKGQF